jgi:glycosyltransferase involved in cell wall biosynthesis
MLHVAGSGISRYLGCILPILIGSSEGRHHWLLYGRGLPSLPYAKMPHVSFRSDHLPHNAGRIASLFLSQVAWARIDQPDVYWSPAHRLPWSLPKKTAAVVTIHDLCWLKQAETMRWTTYHLDRLLMPRSLAIAKQIIAISASTGADIRNHFGDHIGEKVSVTTEGGTHMPPPFPSTHLKAMGIEKPFVLFVGSLEPRKNLPRLLQAFQCMLRRSGADILLVVAGATSWGRSSIAAEIAALRVMDRVLILQNLDDQMLSTLYQNALCLAAPSLLEGFCLPVVEAMSFGTPVLASASSAFPEVVGQGGLLVDPLSVSSISDALFRLVTDEGLRRDLGRLALQQSAAFSWESAGAATLELLERAGEEGRRNSPQSRA